MEESNQQMMTPYKFSQCFGDKSENIEVADGKNCIESELIMSYN